jgi:putative transposase
VAPYLKGQGIVSDLRDRRLQWSIAMARPTRLDSISYVGRERFLITPLTRNRVKAFEDIDFGQNVISELVQRAKKLGFALPAYTLMPDHAHLITEGLTDASDVCKLLYEWKKATGYCWSKKVGGPLWHPGFWDSHLIDEASLDRSIEYVVLNPVRAGLVSDPADYALTGSTVYAREDLFRLVRGERATS